VKESPLAPQFHDLAQQDHAGRFAMWIFLGSELTFFAGLFALYAAYRAMYGRDFAECIAHNDVAIGTANTLILITSSFTVALSVWAARAGRRRTTALLLKVSLWLGLVFLVLKGVEWSRHAREGLLPGRAYSNHELTSFGAHVFFTLYYFMTGLHALHVIAGLIVLAWMAVRAWRGAYTARRHTHLELGTLYWHLVDVVWIFLWPLFYLAS
jgi:cytochrome c oxidase subunit 3